MSSLTLSPGTTSLGGTSLPDGWKALQLRDFCNFAQGGRLGLTKQDNYVNFGVPAYSAAGQDGYVTRTEYRDTRAVLLSAIGANCGRCFYAAGNWTTLANVQTIVPLHEFGDARFLFYRVNRDDYWPRSGSAQPFIKPSDIKTCWVALPPLPEQNGIAQVLDTLDTTIRQTEAIIEKLKQVKQGLLHDLLTRGIDANGELRSPQSQAPHLYKDSPLGWIPSNWRVGPVEAFLDCIIDYRGKTPEKTDSGIPLITARNVRLGYLDSYPQEFIHAHAYEGWMTRGLPKKGDILFTMEAPLGNVAQIETDERLAFAQRLVILQAGSGMDSTFLKFLLLGEAFRQRLFAFGSGSTVEGIQQSTFRRIPIAVPVSTAEQQAIAQRLSELDRRVDIESTHLEKARSLKSGLMDDLLSGRVRVTPLLQGQAA